MCASRARHTWKRRPTRSLPSLLTIQVATGQVLGGQRRAQVVDFDALRRHTAAQAGAVLDGHPERCGMRPGDAVQPGEVDGVVDVAVRVDVSRLHRELDYVGRGQVPVIHTRSAAAADSRATAR